MSLVGTFAVMYLLGYSLDNLSLMALTLAVGFVVDDAIVVLENIVRHIEQGEPVIEAALNGQPRDHLHRHLDDDLPGGGVHPGALPGRAHRPAVPGVRGHDRGGDPGLGVRLAHAHAHALQPLAQAARSRGAARPVLSRRSSGPGCGSLAGYERTPRLGDGPPAARPGVQRADPGRHDRAASGSCPRASSRARIRASSTSRPRRPKAPATTPWWSTSARPRPSCRRIPTSTASCRRWVAAAAAPDHEPGPADPASQGPLGADHERRRGGPLALAQAGRRARACGCSSRTRP